MTDRQQDLIDRAGQAMKDTPNPPGMEERISSRVMADIGAAGSGQPLRSWGPLLGFGAVATAAALAFWMWSGPVGGQEGQGGQDGHLVATAGAAHRFALAAPQATSVAVVGDFNDWNPAASVLLRSADGTWSIDVPLPPGTHRYAFVIDGTRYMPDPAATAAALDDFGDGNSMVTIPGQS